MQKTLSTVLVYTNIHWLVYPEIEVLSFNGKVKHEKLVLPTERV